MHVLLHVRTYTYILSTYIANIICISVCAYINSIYRNNRLPLYAVVFLDYSELQNVYRIDPPLISRDWLDRFSQRIEADVLIVQSI